MPDGQLLWKISCGFCVESSILALAEAAQVDYFCTCDDRFYRRALDLLDLTIKIRRPLELAQEIAI